MQRIVVLGGGENVVIDAIRRDEVPGIHEIEYDSEADTITICHSAHSRKGFALGAVLAAEYSANADECDFQHFYLPPAQYFRRPSRINTPLYYHIFLSFYSHFRLFFNNV